MLALVPGQPKAVKRKARHLGVRLDPDLHRRFAVMAALNDCTKQDEVRRLIREEVERFETKMAKAA